MTAYAKDKKKDKPWSPLPPPSDQVDDEHDDDDEDTDDPTVGPPGDDDNTVDKKRKKTKKLQKNPGTPDPDEVRPVTPLGPKENKGDREKRGMSLPVTVDRVQLYTEQAKCRRELRELTARATDERRWSSRGNDLARKAEAEVNLADIDARIAAATRPAPVAAVAPPTPAPKHKHKKETAMSAAPKQQIIIGSLSNSTTIRKGDQRTLVSEGAASALDAVRLGISAVYARTGAIPRGPAATLPALIAFAASVGWPVKFRAI
jgi:hypothetical protein